MCFNQRSNISTLIGGPLKLVDKFTYLGSSVSLTENKINMWLAQVWTAINRLSVIWKSDLTYKIECSFFQVAVVFLLQHQQNTPMDHSYHHVALVAQISLTLSRRSSLSFIALGRFSGQHCVSSHSCWMYVRAGRPAFVQPCVGVHKSTSLMSSSLLLQHVWFV